MSLLTTLQIDVEKLAPPTGRKPTEAERISGDPAFRTWLQDTSFDGKVKTGIWEATPGLTHAIKDGVYEYCLILDGVVEIAEEGGETRTYRKGDSFVFKPGFRGTWRTVETVRKMFVVVS
ncbi:cupin domain-containing protein [Labrys wisconsinensis]|uniref:Cupin superfamily protein n=1 Tax=Labrys wisconsinensis TaxID=425677 RepID=A0ABU0JGN4_9HYPH|nr:cupin domain-containing protein [Labrys wisconsinensis]MDQ0473455.1 putative cupin superfamily protein [Labrys wisconsinensis]